MTVTASEVRAGWSVSAVPTVLSATQAPLALGLSPRWHLLVVNRSTNPGTVTTCRSRRRPMKITSPAVAWSPWESVVVGLPMGPSLSLSIRETDDCSEELDLELTASVAGTLVDLYLAGTSP